MSETPADSPAPRRSQRDKKVINPTTVAGSSSTAKKRKHADSDTEADTPHVTDSEGIDKLVDNDAGDADHDEEEYQSPKAKAATAGRKGKAKSSQKKKTGPPTKKPRTEKATMSKTLKPSTRKGRKWKEGEDTYDAEQVAKDTKISADNPLFNAIMNPASALQSSAEDFLDSLQQSPGPALAELINLVLRACGCNDSVNADEAVDFDGIVSTLDDFTESLKQENSPVYPLTSKLPVFKRFRKSLSEWIERLMVSASDVGALYSTQMMDTLQQWVVSMSSSQIRSFRHTATVIALEAETALCDVAAAVEKEAVVVARQRQGEKKRKGSKGGSVRDKELEKKAHEISKKQKKLVSYIREFVDSVFVHRYRDLDPNIRAECVRAVGLWFRKYPKHFFEADHILYVAWVLSDSNSHVRLEAVKALSGIYEQVDYIGLLNHFTERFKSRLIEMATSDTELSIRVAVIQVLGAIDNHFLVTDEREKLCLLLFDEEPKVRKAVSHFVRDVWEEAVGEELSERHKRTDKDQERIGLKLLAALLVKWSKVLDNLSGDADESELGDGPGSGDIADGPVRLANRRKEVLGLVGTESRGRVALAVEALWDEVETISDWELLLDILLLDHSASGEDSQVKSTPRPKGRTNGKKRNDDFVVDEAWRLEEVEESILLEVLVAVLRKTKGQSAANAKKGGEENISNDMTRALIKGLPRLFIKHQTDQNRISDVLLIPTLMNLDLYLEMRMITAYTSLWDDVVKQFISHSSIKVLSCAMTAIRYFMDATSLSNANSTKILELEDELSTQLRDTIAGRDEIEVASFSEDEVLALCAWCTRLSVLAGTRNMTVWTEEDEGGKQSSAWDIVNALVERGRLGYKDEETMIERALHFLTLHIFWKTKGLTSDNDPTPEEIHYKEVLEEQRETLLEKLAEYAVGTQSNTVEGVKRAAFKHLLDIYVLFSATQSVSADGNSLPIASLALSMDDEVQYRCAGYIQAEIERYAEFLDDEDEDDNQKVDADELSEDEKERTKDVKVRKKAPRREADLSSRDILEREYLFIDVISTFLRAIRVGAIHVHHGAVVLAHYGRLEVSFDTCSKTIVDVLREEEIMNDSPSIIVTTLTQAVQESYTLVFDGLVRDDSNSVLLAKLLSTCFIVRGSQLSILRRLDSQCIVQIHTSLLSWIGKRIATYENNKNKKSLKTAIGFFRVLMPLLGAVQSRDALKIKANLDQVFAEAKIEIAPTSKVWEPERAYEKRLTAIMAKDHPHVPKVKKPRKGAKPGAAVASSAEESEGEKTLDEDEAAPRPRPKTRQITLANPIVEDEAAIDFGDEPDPVTPKARPRPRPIYRHKMPTGSLDESENGQKSPLGSLLPLVAPSVREREQGGSPLPPVSPSAGEGERGEPSNEFATPKSSLKRPRTEDDEGSDKVNDGTSDHDDLIDVHGTPDMQVRRKRVRH